MHIFNFVNYEELHWYIDREGGKTIHKDLLGHKILLHLFFCRIKHTIFKMTVYMQTIVFQWDFQWGPPAPHSKK